MSKHEIGSSKWLSVQMKARGLSKLKYFCQMCNKQCRDANGFKCHTASDSHRKQMELFTADPEKFVNDFSLQFEDHFLSQLAEFSKGEWVLASDIYSRIVADPEHIHMNATKWETLTEFLEYLFSKRAVRHKETDHGYSIQVIDAEKEAAFERQLKLEKRELEKEKELERYENERRMKIMREAASKEESTVSEPSVLTRVDPGHKVSIQFGKPVGTSLSLGSKTVLSVASQEIQSSKFKYMPECVVGVVSLGELRSPRVGVILRPEVALEGISEKFLVQLISNESMVLSEKEITPIKPKEGDRVCVVGQSQLAQGSVGLLVSVDLATNTGSVFFSELDKIETIPLSVLCQMK